MLTCRFEMQRVSSSIFCSHEYGNGEHLCDSYEGEFLRVFTQGCNFSIQFLRHTSKVVFTFFFVKVNHVLLHLLTAAIKFNMLVNKLTRSLYGTMYIS